MLILPIVNNRRVMNVQIRLRNAEKIRKGVCYDDARESDIIVNREKFSESTYKASRNDDRAAVDFIRSKSLLYPRNFLVTTKECSNSNLYDVYEVAQPPKKINDNLDRLYSKAIVDMQKEIPNSKARGRYVSFDDLGINNDLSDDKIVKLQQIIKNQRDESTWPKLFSEAGISELRDTVDFINNFECVVLSDSTIPEDSLKDTIKALGVINSRDYKRLKKYYETAKSNTDVYTKISYISKLIYDKPLRLVQKNNISQKQLIKKKEEVSNAA